MPVIYSNNLVYDPTPPPTVPLPVWPTIAQDPRPTCCLIVGDGFTQDLLVATDATATIQCSIDSLVPAPASVRYLPVEGDRFEAGPIWDKQKWPRVVKHWEDSGACGREYFKSLALVEVNPTRSDGLWSFHTATLAYELRCYLWHLFRSFQYSVKLDGGRIVRWPWRRVLHYLLSEFRLFVVSFNYDVWLEALLDARLCFDDPYYQMPFMPFVEQRLLNPYHYRAGTVLIVKPHGSIAYHLDLNGIGPLGSNPWLTDHRLSHNWMAGNRTRFEKQTGFPMVPDLVPPGRQGDDFCNPASIAPALGRDFVKQAAVVLLSGLSGAEPDTAEVTDLIDSTKPDTPFVHVGLKASGDDETPVGIHAKDRAASSYAFFDASDVGQLIDHLSALFKPSWKWTKHTDGPSR